jgi:BioD-like phosphotransacetylase family protein
MPSLFVVSTATFSGKTAVIAALMKHLQREGKRPGYFKPVSTTPDVAGRRLADTDAQFIKRTFKLAAALNKIVPIKLTASAVEQAFQGGIDFPAQIKAAYDEVSNDCDVLIVEGCGDLAEGGLFNLSKPEIADMLDLPILVVTRYSARLTGEDVLLAKRILGKRFIGTVVNAVPKSEFNFFSDTVVPILEKRGIPILGILPRQRLLTAASVQ